MIRLETLLLAIVAGSFAAAHGAFAAGGSGSSKAAAGPAPLLADQSSTIATKSRDAHTAGLMRVHVAAPGALLLSSAEPSFSEVVQNGLSAGLAPPTPTIDQRSEFPSKGWGHVLAGLGMILFVAMRRSASF